MAAIGKSATALPGGRCIDGSIVGDEWGMVKLTPEQQKAFCDADGNAFQPCNGAWGRQGCTYVRLAAVKTAVVRTAFSLAVENVNSKSQKRTAKSPRIN